MNTAQVIPHPAADLAQAERFLTRLDEGAELFTFQTFDDLKSRKDRSLARILHGTLDALQANLLRLQWRRAGVYVTVNATDGKGRALANMTRPRAIFCEWDRAGEPVPAWPIEPHMTVETSPGKFHFYWLGADLEWADFDQFMQVMVAWGSDPNAKDRARVLRVPGFWHQKSDEPFQVRLVAESLALPYSRADLLAAFPVTSAPPAPASPTPPPTAGMMPDDSACMAIVVRLAGEHAARTWADPKAGRHSQAMSLGHELESRGIPPEYDAEAVRRYAGAMRPTNTAGEVEGINFENEMKALQHGRQTARNAPTVRHGAAVAEKLLAKNAAERDERFEAALARANGDGPKYRAVAVDAAPVAASPAPLLSWLESEILARVPMRCPRAAQVAAQAILAHLTGRHVVAESGEPTHLYLALVAPSVGDLRPYLSEAYRLVDQMGLGKTARQQRLSAPAQIHKLLWRTPSSLYLCSEWGVILQFAKRQPAGSTEMELTTMAEIWGGQTVVLDADEHKIKDPSTDGQYLIRAPHLTMLAALSQDQLSIAMKLSEMGRGALEQIQYWILDEEDFVEASFDDLTTGPYPDDLLDGLRALAEPERGAGNLDGLTGPDQLPVQAVAHFAEPVQPILSALDDLPAHRGARALLSTAKRIAIREAAALAFALDRRAPLIAGDLLRACVASERERLRRLLERFTALASDDGRLSAYDKVLDCIIAEKSRGLRPGDLSIRCRAYRGLPDDKRDELIKQLLGDGEIVEIQPESTPGARRKSIVYVAKTFAQRVSS